MKSAKAAAEKIGLFTSVLNQLRLVLKLMSDRRVPGLVKLLPIGAVLYLLSPIDLIPDVIVGLGQLDDLGVLILGINALINMAPQYVVQELRNEIGGAYQAHKTDSTDKTDSANSPHASGETVDGSYRVVNDK